jgi:putative ABC transport system permease protein
MTSILQDLRYALRLLVKERSFALIVTLTLMLGVGASTVVFSVVNAILLKPLPYPSAERIVFPWGLAPRGVDIGFPELPWGRVAFQTFARQTRTFESFGAFLGEWINLTGTGDPIRLGGVRVSAGFFPALGIAPALGRTFTAEDDRPGRDREVVLGHRLWETRFNSDRSVVGRVIDLNGAPYTVVGVMPAGFVFPRSAEMPGMFPFPAETELWIPLALPVGPVVRGEPNELAVIGRLSSGVSARQAQAELDLFARQMEDLNPRAKGWFASRIRSMSDQIVGETRRPLLLLLAAVGVVLLIACSNVANLLLNRSIGRARELAVRAALGAARGRLIRQLVIESLVLSTFGGTAGVLLAAIGIDGAAAFGPANLPRLADVKLDGRVLLFALAASLTTGLIFGLAPAVVVKVDTLARSLNEGNSRSGASARGSRLRSALIVSEVALALVLSVSSGLLIRSFVHLVRADGGFNAERVLTFELTLPSSKYADADRIVRFYEAALQRVRAIPMVRAVGMGAIIPLGGSGESTTLRIPDRRTARDEDRPFSNYTVISPGYFSALGTPLLRGRDFLDTDNADGLPVAIVNRAMADRFWPGQHAIGKAVGVPIAPFNMTVVGIVTNVKHATMREIPGPEIYVPYTQKPWPSMQTMHVAVRVTSETSAATTALRAAVAAVDPDVPLANVVTLSTIVSQAVAQPRFAMYLIGSFGALALLLACVGLYGAVSHAVIARTQEIGIRLALGAAPRQMLGMVLAEGLRLTAVGIAAGVAMALIGVRAIAAFLYGVESTDPLTFAVVGAALTGVSLLACYLPATRATRVDPLVAMRAE